MTNYFYDTEFYEDGTIIAPISIGIVADDGREYYAVNSDMPVEQIKGSEWLRENVWPQLPTVGKRGIGHLDLNDVRVKPRAVIRNEVREFLTRDANGEIRDGNPKLWAYYGAYDHVLLAQMWGPMVNLPKGIPMVTHDILTLSLALGVDMLPKQADGVHNALEDARHVKKMYDHIIDHKNREQGVVPWVR